MKFPAKVPVTLVENSTAVLLVLIGCKFILFLLLIQLIDDLVSDGQVVLRYTTTSRRPCE